MKYQTDPKVVQKLAEEVEDANYRFRSFLKGADLEIDQIDAIVHKLYEEVSRQIDCTDCGNCCRQILPTLNDADVKRLAAGLMLTPDEVVSQYLTRDDDGDLTLNQRPCPFLTGNLCQVYEHRPKACKSYPHLHKKEFVFRLAQAVANCSVCPISFNVYELLKAELWHRPDNAWEEDWE
jgi:Fe-S-cluster containining protein